jgi:hypothetical protein
MRVPEAAGRGRGSPGCCVSWVIAGLLGLVFLGGLLMFIRGRGRSRPSADDTLVTDLLGPPDLPAAPTAPQEQRTRGPSPARQARKESEPSSARQARKEGEPSSARQARKEGEPSPARQARKEGEPSPARQAREESEPSPAGQAREESERPTPQVSGEGELSPASSAPPAEEGDWLETQLAWINAWSQRMNQQITSAEQPKPHSNE